MKDQIKMLKSYRKELEVLSLTMNVPSEDSRYLTYSQTLLRLFNNKRDDKDILNLINYCDNHITIEINLTSYEKSTDKERSEVIDHIKTWMSSGLDISNDSIEVEIHKGYIYEISEYENNIKTYEENGNDFKVITNYIEWAD